MKIEFTRQAADRLRMQLPDGATGLRLVYDTEGCGCAVNGVPVLRALAGEAPPPKEAKAESEPFDVWYEPQHEIYFEDKLRIDYSDERGAYVLMSDNQIYTTDLRLIH